MLDHVEREAFSPLGTSPIVWIDCAGSGAEAFARNTQAIVGGMDARGTCPGVDPAAFDLLLTTRADAPAPWVAVRDVATAARRITEAVTQTPIAAAVTAQVLRINERLVFADALCVESLGYSTLLGGTEFRAWRSARSVVARSARAPCVEVTRDDAGVTITLARPDTRNAIDAAMRDELHEALCAVLDDPSAPDVLLRGAGACFSTGGDLAEFGIADDLALAHAIRMMRSCTARLRELGARATVELHGVCIGSGIEVAAAAQVRRALPNTFFRMPELRMGLMPGAGGTVSVARAIGRHRTCYMALSGRPVGCGTATRWGLATR